MSIAATVRGVLGYILNNPSNDGQKLYRLALAIGWQLHKRTIAVPLVIQLDNGLLYIADPAAGNATGVIYSKLYEPEYISFLRQHLSRGGSMIDVGAQTGLYTLHLAHILSCGVCFEPSPDSFELLAKNLRLNALDEFKPVKVAVAAYEGTATFRVTAPFGSTNRLDPTATYQVNVTSLDDYVAKNPLTRPLGLLKIDVEGGELNVLQGARGLLKASLTGLAIIENSKTEDIEAFLLKIGWRCFAIDKRGKILTSLQPKQAAYNLLACGPSHPLWAGIGESR